MPVSLLPGTLQGSMQKHKVWADGAPVPFSRLRLVTVPHIDFEGQQQEGAIVVMDAAAPHVEAIFNELFDLKFPIHSMRTIEQYQGSDDDSMGDNNSSAFNYRPIAGSTTLSIHSYGLAIDVNPLQNPYLELQTAEEHLIRVSPVAGKHYLNRTNIRPGMVEPIVAIFKKRGFSVWGGDWNEVLDYHHFQTTRAVAQMLAILPPEQASAFFDMTIQRPHIPERLVVEEVPELAYLYSENPKNFIKKIS